MRSTASFANQEKTKFIELWVRGETGQINIDVGQVSEDYYVRGEFPDEGGNLIPSYRNLNTEDVNLNGLLDVDQGEDTGIDGVPGSDGSNVPNDAGNDDWAPPRETSPNFLRINGTEGNSDAQGARFPDTEDLDGDGILNLFNNYFEYSFELGKDSEFLVDSTLFSNGTPTGWKLYRIPLSDALFSVGDPDSSFRQVFNVRMWVNNIQPNGSEFDSIQIAQFDFVGNEWEEEGFAESDTSEVEPAEEKFGITVYNT
ncbi:MAG: hypothetical protein GWN44_11125, partial [Calditrichae bacterium]|nr:hypothetical protein [Calditrichia bacterium]